MDKYLELDKEFKNKIIKEINDLKIEGLHIINELNIIEGSSINLEYFICNNKVKLLKDNEVYLYKEVECIFNNNELKSYFSIICNTSFILIIEYQEDKTNNEVVVYKRR